MSVAPAELLLLGQAMAHIYIGDCPGALVRWYEEHQIASVRNALQSSCEDGFAHGAVGCDEHVRRYDEIVALIHVTILGEIDDAKTARRPRPARRRDPPGRAVNSFCSLDEFLRAVDGQQVVDERTQEGQPLTGAAAGVGAGAGMALGSAAGAGTGLGVAAPGGGDEATGRAELDDADGIGTDGAGIKSGTAAGAAGGVTGCVGGGGTFE